MQSAIASLRADLDAKHVDNLRRAGIMEDTLIAIEGKLDAHILDDKAALKDLHDCHDLTSAAVDRIEANVGILVLRHAVRGAWKGAVIARRALLWSGPFAAVVIALYGLYIGKWPFV